MREANNLVPLDTACFEEIWQRLIRGESLLTPKEMTKKWNNFSVQRLLEVKHMFETNVEAEVAGTVLSLLYDDHAIEQ